MQAALALDGGVFIMAPRGAKRGGSLASLRMARELGVRLFVVWLEPDGSFTSEVAE